jgi:hypothetical protein
VIGREESPVNRYRLHFGSLLCSGLLVANCVQVNPAWGGQETPLPVLSELSAQPSVSSVPLRSPDSPSDFPGHLIAQAAEVPAQPSVSSFWASQSLARLIHQHDCMSHGSSPEPLNIDSEIGSVNRYKIAALLFSCLEHWDKQAFDAQEQASLQALRSEFKLELVALRGNSVSDPMLVSANIPRESMRTDLSPQPMDSFANVPLTTTEYSQTIDVASQGRIAMGVHYTDRATGATTRDLLGINAEASLGKVGLFGRYSAALGAKSGRSGSEPDDLLGDRSIQSWTAGIGIRDVMIPHSLFTVSVSQSIPPSNFSQPTQMNYGAFYQFPLTDRLTLSPSIVIMTQSEKTGATPDVQGALQASFSF